MDASDLVGAWRLTEFDIAFSDGRARVHPMGADATGLLVYSASGHVSAVLSRGNRTSLGVGGLEGAHRAAPDAKVAAFDSYMSYAGRWRLEGDQVVHTVDLSLTPDAVGRAQRRTVAFDGQTLALTYDVTGRSGAMHHYRLVWTRAEAP